MNSISEGIRGIASLSFLKSTTEPAMSVRSSITTTTTTTTTTKRIPVFSYGSNGIEQIRERCQNNDLTSRAAKLENYVRIFAKQTREIWDYGAVASIRPLKGDDCYVLGSVVDLSEEELERLDHFEGVKYGIYRREKVVAKVQPPGESDCSSLKEEECIAYIMNDTEWIVPPSEKYLKACQKNIEQFWKDPSKDFSIEIRNETGDIVSVWTPQKS